MKTIRNIGAIARSRDVRQGLRRVIKSADASPKEILQSTILLAEMNVALQAEKEQNTATEDGLTRLIALSKTSEAN
jgi:hypothetical protein